MHHQAGLRPGIVPLKLGGKQSAVCVSQQSVLGFPRSCSSRWVLSRVTTCNITCLASSSLTLIRSRDSPDLSTRICQRPSSLPLHCQLCRLDARTGSRSAWSKGSVETSMARPQREAVRADHFKADDRADPPCDSC
jgi:hypothetical protein